MRSGVGIMVRTGAAKPDISSVDAVKVAVLAAKTVGISTGPSGVYMSRLFEQLGIAAQLKPKLKVPPSGAQIAELVAKGEIELGFQQLSEIVHVRGAELVGPLPAGIQRVTLFAGGVHPGCAEPDVARSLLQFLGQAEHAPALRRHGLEPAAPLY
jgi:molybdate transport system substrate-binding protein